MNSDEGVEIKVATTEFSDGNSCKANCIEVLYKKVFDDCNLPKWATEGAVSYDLYSCVRKTMYPGERVKFSLGFKMVLPLSYFAKIYGHFRLAAKYGIEVMGALTIIDEEFTGAVAVWLINIDIT